MYFSLFRSLIKIFSRLLTGKCELYRIIEANIPQTSRVLLTEESLASSKHTKVRNLLQNSSNVRDLIPIKKIPQKFASHFCAEMKLVLDQLHGYEDLFASIEALRREKFDSKNQNHEKLLLELWSMLQPERVLSNRISRDWEDIGFQGTDPATDFRGMGLLGLLNLHHLASNHPQITLQMIQHSNHPRHGYSFAILGINLTSMAVELLSNGLLRTHFFNSIKRRPQVVDFHHVYVYLFVEFDKFWTECRPQNVMEFSKIRARFLANIEQQLLMTSSSFCLIENSQSD